MMVKRTFSLWRESISMSLTNIWNNKMRSFLTVLGIVIGVTAIIALITIVQGATSEITKSFTAMGTGRLPVSAWGTALKAGLSSADLRDIEAIDHVDGISPSVSTKGTVKSAYDWTEDVSIDGYNEVYFERTEDLVLRGRPIMPLDTISKNHVALLNEAAQKNLFYGRDPLGQTVYISGYEFTVIGILSDAGDSDVMTQSQGGSSDSGQIIIPYTAAMTLSGTRNITSLSVYVSDTAFTQQVIDDLEGVLNAAFNYKDDSYSIVNMESLLDTMDSLITTMTQVLAGIASIALLVGGIGIMNMMLVTVTERTMEIGLRKALGAEPKQIQLQFLIESIILSISGGIVGVLLGIGISYLFALAANTEFVLSGTAIGLGVGFSAAVGIIFGWAPARKASNLNPIEALRSA